MCDVLAGRPFQMRTPYQPKGIGFLNAFFNFNAKSLQLEYLNNQAFVCQIARLRLVLSKTHDGNHGVIPALFGFP